MTVYNFYNPSLHSQGVRGTLTSLVDFYSLNKDILNLKIHNCTTEMANMIMLMNKNNKFGLEKYKLQKTICKDDVIITSARVLIDSTKYTEIQINCKTLIILDSNDILLGNLGTGPNVEIILKNNPNIKYENVIFLCNLATAPLKHEYIEYYHKFNINRLPTMQKLEYKRSNKEHIRAYDYYTENIGKNLIERLILNVPVIYSPEGKGMNDGLHYYLKYLGIDDNIEQELKNIDCSKLLQEEQTILDLLKGL